MKNRASPAQIESARRWLVLEGAAGGAGESVVAAGRVFDKLHAHLAPLVGTTGVQALLARSARLTQREFPFLEVGVVDDASAFRACLEAQDREVAAHAAAALFGTFYTLITTFIGERLTAQLLRNAWPTIDDPKPTEPST